MSAAAAPKAARRWAAVAQLARLAKAERQAADSAGWKDLVAAERARRLSTIDADSKAIEARAVAEERTQAAQQQQQGGAAGAQQGTPPQQ